MDGSGELSDGKMRDAGYGSSGQSNGELRGARYEGVNKVIEK